MINHSNNHVNPPQMLEEGLSNMTSSPKNGHLHQASDKVGERVLLTPRDIIKIY